jgi:tetratricopeptide (TPR) repeat protein
MRQDKQIQNLIQIAKEAVLERETSKAMRLYNRILKWFPNHPDATKLKIELLQQCQKYDEAIALCEELVTVYPNNKNHLLLMSRIYSTVAQYKDSERVLMRTLQMTPKDVSIWCSLAHAIRKQGQRNRAISFIQHAYKLEPDNPEVLTNLGLSQIDFGLYKSAVETQQKALSLAPDQVPILVNLGNALRRNGKPEESLKYYSLALEIDPCALGIEWNQAMSLLLAGNFSLGFSYIDGRFTQPGMSFPSWWSNVWNGINLQGGTLLIEAEQGFGDLLQFARFFSILAKENTLLLRCNPKMMNIMSNCLGIEKVYSNQSPPPPHDARIPIFSIPKVLNLSNIPPVEPYIQIDNDLQEKWRVQLATDSFKIGIAWQGNPTYEEDHHRSIPLQFYEPLFQIPGIHWYSLQKFHGQEQLQNITVSNRPEDIASRLDTNNQAFEDTACVITQLDLIISSDTSIVHLAGALGTPTWVLLPYAPDWRWGLKSNTTPWYKEMKLYRQNEPKNWKQVMERVCIDLQNHVNQD